MPNLLHVRNSEMLVEHSQDHGHARQLNSSCLPTSTLDNSDRKEAAQAWCNVVDKYKHEICNAVGLSTREDLHHRARNTRFCNSVSQQWRSARGRQSPWPTFSFPAMYASRSYTYEREKKLWLLPNA